METIQLIWKQSGNSSQILLSMELLYDPEILLWGVDLREIKIYVHTNTYINVQQIIYYRQKSRKPKYPKGDTSHSSGTSHRPPGSSLYPLQKEVRHCPPCAPKWAWDTTWQSHKHFPRKSPSIVYLSLNPQSQARDGREHALTVDGWKEGGGEGSGGGRRE